jgi:phage tail-like protein
VLSVDANGLRFRMLADARDWGALAGTGLSYDAGRRALRLVSRRGAPAWADLAAEAVARVEVVPQARDAAGTRAYRDPAGKVWAAGALPGSVEIYAPPAGHLPTDLAMGDDGVLYIARPDAVVLLDRRDRWPTTEVRLAGFTPWRLAAHPGGGAWVLDRDHRRLGRARGLPERARPETPGAEAAFRPCDADPDPPRLEAVADTPAGETPVALACGPEGAIVLLTWAADGTGRVRLLADRRFGPPRDLEGVPHPFSVAWVAPGLIGVLLAGVSEAAVFDLSEPGDALRPVGDFYPLRDHDGGPFAHGPGYPPHYPTHAATAPLYRLSLPSFARRGGVGGAKPFDGGSTQTVWHRLYLEAALPPLCGVTVRLFATDREGDPPADAVWFEHRFGAVPGPAGDQVPRGAWVPVPSEVAFHPGLLDCPPEPDRAGLFTALVQRPGRRVRALRGRFLWVKVELSGDGRSTPAVAALRVYASRFSYADHYLPELYRETEFGPDADATGAATPADFLERFLGLFEGVLTPLEDRIASAHLLTDPRTAPDDALEWLASWVGFTFDPAVPADRRRAMLESASALSRSRGTPAGLALALELVTGGAVTGGRVVVVEDFRLRRTLSTILGAQLGDPNDPLLPGLTDSGNSIVGGALFLGDPQRAEFLSLFAASVALKPGEQEAVTKFLDDLAYRVTVLVFLELPQQEAALVRRAVERETPAHVRWAVKAASRQLMVGVSALVGVDTYLHPPAGRPPVTLGRSALGLGDVLEGVPSLDPRRRAVEEPGRGAPIADLRAPAVVDLGQPLALDARGSRPGGASAIVRYTWTLLD